MKQKRLRLATRLVVATSLAASLAPLSALATGAEKHSGNETTNPIAYVMESLLGGSEETTGMTVRTSAYDDPSTSKDFEKAEFILDNEDPIVLSNKLADALEETVTDAAGKTLKRGTHYVLEYSSSKNGSYSTSVPNAVGTYYVRAKALPSGGYTGVTNSCQFEICPKNSLASLEVQMRDEYAYTGGVVKLSFKITKDGTVLKQGTDYVLKYYDEEENALSGAPSEAGYYYVAAVAVSGSEYVGQTGKKDFEIFLTMKNAVVTIESQTYTGKARRPEPEVELDEVSLDSEDEFDVTYANNVNVGTARVTITGKGDYKRCGSVTKTFKITPATITKATLKRSSLGYNGKAQILRPIVKANKLSVPASGYTITYTKKKSATAKAVEPKKRGTYYARIKGKGNFKGTAYVQFSIVKGTNPLNVLGKTVTVKHKVVKKGPQSLPVSNILTIKNARGKTTYQITKYVTVKGRFYFAINTTTGALAVKKGTPKGTYTIKVKVSAEGNANYKKGSKVATMKVKVA